MHNDFKYIHKTTYRINDRIKAIIDGTAKDVRKETGLKLSLGKLSRAFWISMASDPALRKKFIGGVCKMVLDEASKKQSKYYYITKRKREYNNGNKTKR
jgi:hypothetical protein